jgi:hypothetical protein
MTKEQASSAALSTAGRESAIAAGALCGVDEPTGSGQSSTTQGVAAFTIAEKVLGWHWQSTFEPQVGAVEEIALKMQLVAQSGI